MKQTKGFNKLVLFALVVCPLLLIFTFFGKDIVRRASSAWEGLSGAETVAPAAP